MTALRLLSTPGAHSDAPPEPGSEPMTHTDQAWHADAACRDAPLDVFFPEDNTSNRMYDDAAFYCRNCPVLDACKQAAIREERHLSGREHLHGYRAGMTPVKRWEFLKPHHDPLCTRCGTQPRIPRGPYCQDCRQDARRDTWNANHRRSREAAAA